MNEIVIPDTTMCAACGATYVEHSAGSRFCPDADASDTRRVVFRSTTFAD